MKLCAIAKVCELKVGAEENPAASPGFKSRPLQPRFDFYLDDQNEEMNWKTILINASFFENKLSKFVVVDVVVVVHVVENQQISKWRK